MSQLGPKPMSSKSAPSQLIVRSDEQSAAVTCDKAAGSPSKIHGHAAVLGCVAYDRRLEIPKSKGGSVGALHSGLQPDGAVGTNKIPETIQAHRAALDRDFR
jgi:hypothetical protein